jgi:hypothetical protein
MIGDSMVTASGLPGATDADEFCTKRMLPSSLADAKLSS